MRKSPAIGHLLLIGVFTIAFALFVFATNDVSRELDRLERILALLEKSHRYFWQVRPDLDTRFESAAVYTDKEGFRLLSPGQKEAQSDIKIVTFGASPTFGYGVTADHTYPNIAQQKLVQAGINISVKNLGQVGYSSWQGRRRFADYISSHPVDIATVSYMVNDIDRLRFFLSNAKDDIHTEPPSAFSASFYNFITQNAVSGWFVDRFRRLLIRLLGDISMRPNYELSHLRVLAEDYEQNLRDFVTDSKKAGIQLVFIKMPFRLPDPIPPLPEEVEQLFEKISKLIEQEKYDEAGQLLDRAIQLDSYSSQGHYFKGRVAQHQKKQDEANKAYTQAVKHLIYECERDARNYNEIMEKVARQSNTPLVDAASGLGGEKANMELFVPGDYIHPNEKGHRIVGRCLASLLEKIIEGQKEFFKEDCSAFISPQ